MCDLVNPQPRYLQALLDKGATFRYVAFPVMVYRPAQDVGLISSATSGDCDCHGGFAQCGDFSPCEIAERAAKMGSISAN